MELMHINDDGFPERVVREGDEVVTLVGAVWVVSKGIGSPPHKPSSTGRICVQEMLEDGSLCDFVEEFFPGVFNCAWVEEAS